MYTFLYVANFHGSIESFLQRSSQITKKNMPSLGLELVESYYVLPESNSGWLCIRPPEDNNYPPISHIVDSEFVVLAFGHTVDKAGSSLAQTILSAWKSRAVKGVREIEGCFSAVIANRKTGKVTLISDLVGQRTLRYCVANQMLLVSPHEVPLVATGYIPMDFDFVSAASIASVKWSLRGKSLLKRISTCHPAEYVNYSKGEISIQSAEIIRQDSRIPASETKALKLHRELMIEAAQKHLQTLLSESEVTLSLTAGIDSRVVLSLLLSVVSPSVLRAITNGGPQSLDVQVARQLSEIYKVHFSSNVPKPKLSDDFLTQCDLLAFCMNGDATSKNAMSSAMPTYETHAIPKVGGLGGEIFRGYCYPKFAKLLSPHLSITEAISTLKKQWINQSIPYQSPSLLDGVISRFNTIIDEYSVNSRDGHDSLDLFYLYERFSVWGGKSKRMMWNPTPNWSPFSSRKLIQLAFMLPNPIGKQTHFHREVIRRFAPETYWIPINGSQFLPIPMSNKLSPFLGKASRGHQKILKKMGLQKKKNVVNEADRNTTAMQNYILNFSLMGTIREILFAENSFSRELFGNEGIEHLLNEQRHQLNRLDLISSLLTMERWRTMVQTVSRDAMQQGS